MLRTPPRVIADRIVIAVIVQLDFLFIITKDMELTCVPSLKYKPYDVSGLTILSRVLSSAKSREGCWKMQ